MTGPQFTARPMLSRLSTAIALTALVGGVAQAHEPQAHEPQGRGSDLLSELPADAPPGECYAHVRVAGDSIEAPPVATGAKWVMTPGPYGSPGPIWCLVPTGMRAQAPIPTMREGWIRVLCEQDATHDRIRGVQERLHERGYYDGPATGEYDADTRGAVGRFQERERLDHGGYLSLDTLDALDRGYQSETYRSESYQGDAYQGGGYRGAYSAYGYDYDSGWRGSDGYALGYASGPAYSQPPAYRPPPVAAPGPCCVQTYRGGGYYPVAPYNARGRWLTWSGKTEF